MDVREQNDEIRAVDAPDLPAPTISVEKLRALAAEGRLRRKRFEASVAPLKVLTTDDLRIRAR